MTTKDLKVLIVDDEETYRTFLEGYFEIEGITAKSAENGEAALAILEKEKFDIILSDLRMGGMLGTELLRIVKQRWPEIEMVMMSAYASLNDAVAAVRHGAFDILVKPFEDLDVVKKMIERIEKKIEHDRASKRVVASLRSNNEKLTSLQEAIQWLQAENTNFLTRAQYQRVELGEIYEKILEAAIRFTGADLAVFFRTEAEANMFRVARVVGGVTKAQGLLITVPDAPDELTTYGPFRDGVEAWADRKLHAAQLIDIAGERHGALAVLGEDSSLVGEFERGLIAQFCVQVSLMLTGNTQYQKVLELTNRDGLTGLYNHRYLQARLRAEVARAKRHAHALTVVFCDIDHFKWYNDKNGHPQGDTLLMHVARVLEETSRDSDILFRPKDTQEIAARYGGEEFLLILPETDKVGGTIKAERIREIIAATPFANREMQPFGFLSISVGVATYPEDGLEALDLIKAADNALYRAKEQGRNRVCAAGLK